MSEVCDICMCDEPSYRSKDGEVVCDGCYKKELTAEQRKEFVKI